MRILALAFALFVLAAPRPALAEAPTGAPPILGTLLSIDADGKSTGTPDQATIDVGVITQALSAADAMAQNAERMTAVMRALRGASIAERDIRTSSISVQPLQEYHQGEPPRITGYQAANTVSITVRVLSALGRTVDAAINAGGNQLNAIRFGYADPGAQLDAARRDAVAEARRRGDLYAQSLNMHVFRIISVSESTGMRVNADDDIVVTGMRAQGVATTPIAPGERETHLGVHVTFELR